MSRQRHVIDDTLFSYVFCIQNIIKKKNSQRNLNLIVVPKYKIPTYQNLKPRVNELCDARIPDVISNFCVFLSASCSWKKNNFSLATIKIPVLS